MAFSPTQTVIAMRYLRTLGAVVVASVIGFASSSDALNLVGADKAWVLTLFLVPMLVTIDKWLRGGAPDVPKA